MVLLVAVPVFGHGLSRKELAKTLSQTDKKIIQAFYSGFGNEFGADNTSRYIRVGFRMSGDCRCYTAHMPDSFNPLLSPPYRRLHQLESFTIAASAMFASSNAKSVHNLLKYHPSRRGTADYGAFLAFDERPFTIDARSKDGHDIMSCNGGFPSDELSCTGYGGKTYSVSVRRYVTEFNKRWNAGRMPNGRFASPDGVSTAAIAAAERGMRGLKNRDDQPTSTRQPPERDIIPPGQDDTYPPYSNTGSSGQNDTNAPAGQAQATPPTPWISNPLGAAFQALQSAAGAITGYPLFGMGMPPGNYRQQPQSQSLEQLPSDLPDNIRAEMHQLKDRCYNYCGPGGTSGCGSVNGNPAYSCKAALLWGKVPLLMFTSSRQNPIQRNDIDTIKNDGLHFVAWLIKPSQSRFDVVIGTADPSDDIFVECNYHYSTNIMLCNDYTTNTIIQLTSPVEYEVQQRIIPPPGMPVTWYKHNSTQEQYNHDVIDCKEQASVTTSFEPPIYNNDPQWNHFETMAVNGHNTSLLQENFNNCMESKGWTVESKEVTVERYKFPVKVIKRGVGDNPFLSPH